MERKLDSGTFKAYICLATAEGFTSRSPSTGKGLQDSSRRVGIDFGNKPVANLRERLGAHIPSDIVLGNPFANGAGIASVKYGDSAEEWMETYSGTPLGDLGIKIEYNQSNSTQYVKTVRSSPTRSFFLYTRTKIKENEKTH